jgi:hypothetical protein
MSLSRLAIRLATVAALRDATLAGAAVRDSEVTTIDAVASSEKRPFIAVYTDDGEFTVVGRDLQSGEGSFSLVIEFGVTARMAYTLEGGETEDINVLVPTDAQMELTLDLMARQISVALLDAQAPWAEIWRRLISKVGRVASRRGASAEKGERFAGRQIEIEVTPYADPAIGLRPGALWQSFLAQLESDPDTALKALGPVIRRQIVGETLVDELQSLRQQLGLTAGEAASMLASPPAGVTGDVAIAEVVAAGAEPAP